MPLSSLPSTTTPRAPRAQARRVKRGIVAGYIHEISARHGDEDAAAATAPTQTPLAEPAPAPAAPLAPAP